MIFGLQEIAYGASPSMSEAEYLRNVIVWSFSALGVLFGMVSFLFVWIYKSDQEKTRERLDDDSAHTKMAVESLANKIEERDRALNRRLDSQDNVLQGMRVTQFEDGQSFRDLFHQHDKRIDRLEREDLRRSQQVRQGDDPRAI